MVISGYQGPTLAALQVVWNPGARPMFGCGMTVLAPRPLGALGTGARMTVVLNAAAGSLAGRALEAVEHELHTLFQASGSQVTIVLAEGAGIHEALRRAAESDAEVVIAGGGDGTVATAAALLSGTRQILGILPLGTLNLFAKDLGIPLDPAAAVPALARGVVHEVDVGDVNGVVFLNNSVLGVYPRMVEERELQRRRHGIAKWPAMLIGMVKVLYRFSLLTVTLEFDHEQRRLATPVVAVANNAYDDGFGRFLRRSRLDRGELAVYVTRHRTPLGFLGLMMRLVVGTWQRQDQLETFTTRALTVMPRRRHRHRPLKVANDGEIHAMIPPLVYRVRPRALRVLVPVPDGDAAR